MSRKAPENVPSKAKVMLSWTVSEPSGWTATATPAWGSEKDFAPASPAKARPTSKSAAARAALLRTARVALHRLGAVRDQVVAAAELDIHLRPGILRAVAQADETVVEDEEQGPHQEDGRDDHDYQPDHAPTLIRRTAGDPDRVFAAFVRAHVEPAVAGDDFEPRSLEKVLPLLRGAPRKLHPCLARV